MMKQNKIQTLVLTSLFMALVCVATWVLKIPSPTGGYIHPGDSIVFLAPLFLGPIYGFLAASIGSAMADVFGGYIHYAIPTFLIKGFAALSVYGIHYCLQSTRIKVSSAKVLISTILSSSIILSGYFIFDSYLLELGTAVGISSLYFNIVQCGFGVITASILYPMIVKVTNSLHIKVTKSKTSY